MALEFPVKIQDKDLANAYSADFRKYFVTPLKQLLRETKTPMVSDQLEASRQNALGDPFKIPFREFLRLPVFEKDKLVDEAERRAKATLDKAFATGHIWVLLCGSSDVIRSAAKTPKDILSDSQIIDFGKRQGRAPFQFSKPLQVDDIGWAAGCSALQQLDDYPTVSMEIKGEEYVVHFDSGCPFTLFSYEELLGVGAITPTSQFALGRRGDKPYRHTSLKVRVLLKDQRNAQVTTVTLSGHAVRDWDAAPLLGPARTTVRTSTHLQCVDDEKRVLGG
jgi:hypothetical protein